MSDMTLMAMYVRDLEARLARLERQDKAPVVDPGEGGNSFSDAEGDPAAVGTAADGTSIYAARRDHVHAIASGAGSGLDADKLDGQHGSYYLPVSTYTAADILTKIKTVDGASSGLDADKLDGQHASDILAALGAPAIKTWRQTVAWAAGGPFASRMICPPGYTDVAIPLTDAGEDNFYFYRIAATVGWYGAGYASPVAGNALVFYVRGTATPYGYEKAVISSGVNAHVELGTDIYPSIKPTAAWAGGLGGLYSLTVDLLIEQYALPYNGVYGERNWLANPLPLPGFTDIGGVPKYGGTEIALLPTSGGDADTLNGFAGSEYTSRRAADQVSYAMTGTGWKRVARFGGGATGRGEITLLVAVTGADASTAMRVHAAHGIAWGTSGITIDSPLRGSRITRARVTNDGTYAYLELYFASIASGVSLTFRMLRDDAWSGAGNALLTAEAAGGGTAECYAYVRDTGISTSGTIDAAGAIAAGGATITANGANTSFVGTDHVYVQMYPNGEPSGRKAYVGFPVPSTPVLAVANETDAGYIQLMQSGNGPIDFYTNGAHRLRVTGGGNLEAHKDIVLGCDTNYAILRASPNWYTLNNNGEAALPALMGLLVVMSNETGYTALFLVNGSGNWVHELSDPYGGFSATNGNAGTVNIFNYGGTYLAQNKTGATCNLKLVFIAA